MRQDDEMFIRQQAKLLGVNRSTFYYRLVSPDPMDLYIKRLIDEAIHPELGSRRVDLWLRQHHSLNINRKAVQEKLKRLSELSQYEKYIKT